MRTIASWLGRGICTILGVVLLIAVYIQWPDAIVWMLDANLAATKLACGLLPPRYDSMAESALRMGLGVDKALLFAEASALVKMIFAIPRGLLRK